MFVVGKKYKDKNNNALKVVKVLAATQKHVIIEAIIWGSQTDFVGQERAWEQNVFYCWEEYIEPRVVVTELTVREWPNDDGGGLYTVLHGDDTIRLDRDRGRIRITHTEGQGLAVEVIE